MDCPHLAECSFLSVEFGRFDHQKKQCSGKSCLAIRTLRIIIGTSVENRDSTNSEVMR